MGWIDRWPRQANVDKLAMEIVQRAAMSPYGECFARQEVLAHATRLSLRTVQRGLVVLEATGVYGLDLALAL